MSGPDNVVQCLPLACTASNRYVSNTHVFVSCCEASLKKSYETVAIFCADLMDNQFNVFQQLYSRILTQDQTIYDK
jgi:hypothetical protein